MDPFVTDYTSEITNGPEDEIYDRINNEERCIREVGCAIYKGHFFDSEFRAVLRPLIVWLGKRCGENALTQDTHYQDMFNHLIVSAFHSARSAELLFETAIDYQSNNKVYDHLICVHHSFGNQIVNDLAQAQRLLTDDDVLNSLVTFLKDEIESIFASLFPKLIVARDSVAHAEERRLGKLKKNAKSQIGVKNLRQSIGQAGSKLIGLIDKDGIEFSIDCHSAKIVALVENLKKLFQIQ
jgi:hypothetical protein